MKKTVLGAVAALCLLAATPALAQTTAFDRGVQAFNAGNFSAAAAAFDEAYRANPDTETLRNRAISYYKAGDYRRSMADYEILMGQQEVADDLIMYANALDQTGQYPRAVQIYQRAATLPKGELSAWQELGIAHVGARKYDLAAEAYGKAAAESPGNAGLRVSQASALYDAGRFAEALPVFQAATRLDPTNVKAWRLMGDIQVRLSDLPGGLTSYDRALAVNPNDFDVHFSRGAALFNAKRYPEAVVAYRRASQIDPNSPLAQAYLGDAQRLSTDYVAARQSYEASLRLDAKQITALKGLIPILIVNGDIPTAKTRIAQLQPLDAAAAAKFQDMLP